ncbi:MAG: peptidyl-prolyl cis-trans isomerase [Candidatus Firestonebacteria bacterium]
MKQLGIVILLLCAAGLYAEEALVDRVLVVVNEETVTKSEFEAVYIPAFRMRQNATNEQADKLKKDILNQLIAEKLIVQEAKKRNYEISKGEIEGSLEQVKARNGGAAKFAELIKTEGLTESDIREKLKNSILGDRVMSEAVRSGIKIELKDIQEEYEKNKEQFTSSHISFKRILIKTTGNDDAKAKETAETAVKKIKDGGEFSETAKLFSNDDYTRENSDKIFSFNREDLDKAVADVVFGVAEGELAGPVKVGDGYALFKVIKKEAGKVVGLGDSVEFRGQQVELRMKIKQILFEEQYAKKSNEFIAGLKQKAVIELKTEKQAL